MHGINPKEVILNAEITYMSEQSMGYAIFVSHNISLDPAVYWKHSFTDKFNQYGIKMGLSVYF